MLSVVVLTRNEEKNIKDCLENLSFADEVLIVDNHSADKTVSTAQNLGAKVVQHKISDDFAAVRNFALTQAKGDWVLFVDADERVTPELAGEVKSITAQHATNSSRDKTSPRGYLIHRLDYAFGKLLRYGETGQTWLLRLAQKDVGKWQRRVHEEWEVSGLIGRLKNPLLHYSHPDIESFIDKINRYSTLDAQEFFEQGRRESLLRIFINPLGKLLQNYLIKQGFRDGVEGFIFAVIMSVHSFLTRVKLWLLWKKKSV